MKKDATTNELPFPSSSSKPLDAFDDATDPSLRGTTYTLPALPGDREPGAVVKYLELKRALEERGWRKQEWDWKMDRAPRETDHMRLEWWNRGRPYVLVYVDGWGETATATVIKPLAIGAVNALLRAKDRRR